MAPARAASTAAAAPVRPAWWNLWSTPGVAPRAPAALEQQLVLEETPELAAAGLVLRHEFVSTAEEAALLEIADEHLAAVPYADDHYDSARRHRPLAAELGFLGIYVADIALAYRVHRIFSVFRGPLILHQLCVLVIAADVFNCGLAFARHGRRPVRFSRGLRALLLISHSDWLAYALRQLRRREPHREPEMRSRG